MSEENPEVEVEKVEVEGETEVDVVDKTDEEVEVEAKASKMGWTPKDEFKGDPNKWRPASAFVERGENMLPLVKAQVKRQERELNEMRETLRQFGEYHNKTEQKAYERALADLREQRAQAIASGDGAAFDRTDNEIEKLKDNINKSGMEAPQQEAATDPVFVEWKKRNKWIDDPELEEYALDRAKYHRKAGNDDTDEEFLETVKRDVKYKYPEKFDNPRRQSAPSVEGGVPAARKGGKGYADMPAEAKAACKRMATNAYADKPKEQAAFEAQYVKQYFEGA